MDGRRLHVALPLHWSLDLPQQARTAFSDAPYTPLGTQGLPHRSSPHPRLPPTIEHIHAMRTIDAAVLPSEKLPASMEVGVKASEQALNFVVLDC